jgi:hypothetical protein
MENEWPLILGSAYAAHIDRSLYTVAARIGVHPKLFERLRDGKGCHVDTYTEVLRWFDLHWPADLEWPEAVPRKLIKAITARRTVA